MTSGVAALLQASSLGRLMPMFLWVGAPGKIRAMGPTLAKLVGDTSLIGQPFAEHFTITSSHQFAAPGDLRELPDKRLHLTLRRGAATGLRGLAVPVGTGGADGVLLNLSFGVSISDAVREHALTDADFAATDLAMELLYLQEAKSAVMAELRGLNARLEGARKAAEAQALSDPLTGLANRRALELELQRATELAVRGGAPFTLAHLDLDHFKAVNDTLGHAAGDHVLAHVAATLREETRRRDLVARVGGDEFVLLLRGLVDPVQVQALGERIIRQIERPSTFEGANCRVSASIGVAISTTYALPIPETMLADADAALYTSKRQGRGRCSQCAPEALPRDAPPGAGNWGG